jgi:hypothetical protein
MTACEFVSIDRDKPKADKTWIPRSGGSFHVEDRYESNLTIVDPVSLEIKKRVHLRYPNYSGTAYALCAGDEDTFSRRRFSLARTAPTGRLPDCLAYEGGS